MIKKIISFDGTETSLFTIFLLAILLLSRAACSAPPSVFDPQFDLIFEHITVDDGLPENSVRAIIQDRHGFIWLGTQNGLVRYDGYTMLVHAPTPGDSLGFGGRTIDALLEDSRGDIWIGTFLAGLWQYRGETGVFQHVTLHREGQSESLRIFDIAEDGDGILWVSSKGGLASLNPETNELIWHDSLLLKDAQGRNADLASVMVDDQGRIWCGFEGAGIAVYDPGSGKVENYRHQDDSEFSLLDDTVYDLFQDPRGRIWAATNSGLSLWRESQLSFSNFQPRDNPLNSEVNLLTSLAMDKDGVLWIGSATGLMAFEPDARLFKIFEYDKNRPSSPVNGPVLCILIDRSGLIWGGSWHTGLNKADPHAGRFHISQFSMAPEGHHQAAVDAIIEDRQGRLWLGLADKPHGKGDGKLLRRDAPDGQWSEIFTQSLDKRNFYSVRNLLELENGTIIVGTYSGLWQIAGDVARPIREMNPALPEIFDSASIKSMAQDQQGQIWFATWRGLVRLNLENNEIRIYRHHPENPNSLSSDGLTTVMVDRKGTVWVGADSDGLNRYRPESDDFIRYFDPKMGLSTISDLHEAADGNIWLASFSGLVEFDPESETTRVFGTPQGLPNQQIVSLVTDDTGTFWVSTGFGLASFNPTSLEVRTFDTRDGLPDNTVKFARCGTNDGHLYFGGEAGLVSFEPARFVFSKNIPPVVVTDIELSDVSLQPRAGSPLLKLAHLVDVIEFPHDMNTVGLEFAALDFSRPDQNRFLFQLEGVDGDWRDPGDARKVVYTDLRPGHYQFRVKASNHDGVWNDAGALLNIHINPPWWQTMWAYGVYLLLLILVAWIVYRQVTMRERMRGKLAVERAEARKLLEIDELKTRFLTNITHEFRTPLTLIKVPLQQLQSKLQGEDAETAETMVRNADRLEQLIDQLLDLSRLEAGRLPLNWRRGDCLVYLTEYVGGFQSLTSARDVSLEVNAPTDPCDVWHDTDILEKLVGNLMTNAVKHTPEGGVISVQMSISSIRKARPHKILVAGAHRKKRVQDLVITVSNSGSYIPPSEHKRIFDRFHQASQAGGAGVGLSLVRELTQWLGGRVSISSDQQQGTSFTVTVPVFIDHPDGQEKETLNLESMASTSDPKTHDSEEESTSTEPRILVVEDNLELRTFMVKSLSTKYVVLEAENGEKGVEIAVDEIPDLILSDVMMPGMDGFDLCQRLKEDERTSHVPIILLTARTDVESRHQGLRMGADDYLAKPFNAEDLWLRIDNLIQQRQKLARKYEKLIASSSADTFPVESADDRFLAQLRDVVEENLDNADFSVMELCSQAAMSRSQLHRKMTALTGNSAGVFIRVHRLRRAAKLFEGGYGNVTEVAYAVGFSSLSYFAQTFREFHGQSPSEFLNSYKNK